MKTSLPGGLTPELVAQALEGGAAVPPVETTEGEATVVRPRVTELFNVEVWYKGVRQSVVPITKQEISIGRGSRSVTVDLPLKGDPEVSRVHAVLSMSDEGQYFITPKGRNPTLVNGQESPRDAATQVAPDEKIDICAFSLRIQPK
jgi:hypothetical protein